MIVGHAHPEVVKAIQEQAERGTTYYMTTRTALDLAQRIVDAVPCGESLRFVSSGTESTYLALRLARAKTGNEKILKFEGGYHGWHDQALVSSNRAGVEALNAVDPPTGTVDTRGADPGTVENVVTAPFNDAERTAEIMEAHADDLAAVITEPVMRTIPPKDGFLSELRKLCDEHDVALVFDEIVTGFRLAWGGAQEYYGVEPDRATYGKAIGGGTPIAAVVGKEEYLNTTDPGITTEEGGVTLGGTLNGNPLSAAAGQATLDLLEEPGVYDHLHEYADDLRRMFEEVLEDSSLNGTSIGGGPIVDYLITEEPEVTDIRELRAADSETKAAIDERLFFEHNIIKSVGGKIYLSTQHGDQEFERTAEAFKEAVETVAD
jgi:glutamate-1-semialdehyde 2,1-aminomutase